MTILVTGCAGFIGSHLCEKLLEKNINVYGIDNINDYYDIRQKEANLKLLSKYKNFSFRKDNIITTKIIDEVKPEIIVNLAAMAGVRYSLENPELYMRVNVEGQINLLNQSVKNNVKLFIYASSSSVYGLNTNIPFKETDTIDKLNNPYAASKRSAEIMAKLYNQLYKLPVIGLRFFTVYGPRGRPDMAPYKFLDKIDKGEKIDKYGDGSSRRDFTYIDDIVNGILEAINNKNNVNCEVYNLGNTQAVSLDKFIKTCEEVIGKKANYNQLSDQKGDVPITFSDITKAKIDLDYNPQTCLKEGLQKTYEWLKLNR